MNRQTARLLKRAEVAQSTIEDMRKSPSASASKAPSRKDKDSIDEVLSKHTDTFKILAYL